MSVDVTTSVVIDAPRATVAEYAADPTHAPEWYVNVKSVDWITPPPLAVGSQVAFVAHFLGRELRYTYDFVDYEPGARVVMRTAQGPFPMETTYTFSDADEGSTRMTLRNCGVPSGFSRITAVDGPGDAQGKSQRPRPSEADTRATVTPESVVDPARARVPAVERSRK